MYFINKRWIVFDKYNEILEKVSNIVKNKFNRDLACYKKYLKAKKTLPQKNALTVFLIELY